MEMVRVTERRVTFQTGQERSRFKSRRQAIVRGIFDGFLIAFLIWGPWHWWARLACCLFARFLYGTYASSDRFAGKL